MQTQSQILAETIAAQKKMFALVAAELVAFATANTKPVKAFTVNCKVCPHIKECSLKNDLGFIKGQIHCPIAKTNFYKSIGRPAVAIPATPKNWSKQLTSFINANQQ